MPFEAALDGAILPDWRVDAGIGALMSTRFVGVSMAPFDSLNLGRSVGDEPAALEANRRRFALAIGARPVWMSQVHGTRVLRLRAGDGAVHEADAAIATEPGLACTVMVADCLPVLFAAPQARGVAAAHAGWRGALGGVIESALAAMERLGARRQHIRAALGPCIGQAAYEVGPEFEQEFLRQDIANARFFSRQCPQSRPHFSLAAYAEDRLLQAGIGDVASLAPCTYVHADDFFSYRRSRAQKEGDYGRQISAIVLT